MATILHKKWTKIYTNILKLISLFGWTWLTQELLVKCTDCPFNVEHYGNSSMLLPVPTVRVAKSYIFLKRTVVVHGHKRVTINANFRVVGLMPTRGNEILNIFVSLFWYRGKAQRWISPFNTQRLQNPAKSGERKCLNSNVAYHKVLTSILVPRCNSLQSELLQALRRCYVSYTILSYIHLAWRAKSQLKASII